MSLRTKFIVGIITINLTMMSVVYLITQTILMNNASKLEMQSGHNAIERTSKIVEKRIETLANVARDYAVWDDTYEYVEEQNEEYIQSNYIDETFSVNSLDVIAIYSLQNERLFLKSYAIDQSESEILPILNELLLQANQSEKRGIYLNKDGTPFLYAMHTITTSDEKSPTNGMLIMMRSIDQSERLLISDQAGRSVTWLPFEESSSVIQNPYTTVASTKLDNIGAGQLSISIHIPRDITQNIIDARNTIIMAMVIVSAIAIVGIYAFVNYNVLKPVNQIVQGVQRINTLGNTRQYIQISTHDEFEHVSQEINTMLGKLKTSQDQVVAAQSEIAKQRALEEKKDEFFSIASHELRTPLTAIRGNIEYLCSAYAEIVNHNQEVKDILADMQSASMRLISLVNDFLTTSRIDQNKMKPALGTFDAYTIVKESLQEMSIQVKNKGLSLVIEPPSHPLSMQADVQFMQHILENLIGNSIKFTPEGGNISITMNADKNSVYIYVTDTGRGIAKEEQKELFQRFRQANPNPLARDTTQGSGLGLYISRKMAHAMNGNVELLQSDIGKGSTFMITIPRAASI